MGIAGAVLLEIHDERAIDHRRYLSAGCTAKIDRLGDDGAMKEAGRARELLLVSYCDALRDPLLSITTARSSSTTSGATAPV